MPVKLILASKSPRRSQLLRNAGFEVEVRVAAEEVPEIHVAGEHPVDYVRRLARAKASSIDAAPGEVVLAADTVVVLDEHVLEKPVDEADAVRMVGMLSGRTHTVVTGICLRKDGHEIVDHAVTEVEFSPLTAEEIADYAASGEPADKAGAYAIQGLASKFVTRISGCHFNIVGLPVSLVYRRLRDLMIR